MRTANILFQRIDFPVNLYFNTFPKNSQNFLYSGKSVATIMERLLLSHTNTKNEAGIANSSFYRQKLLWRLVNISSLLYTPFTISCTAFESMLHMQGQYIQNYTVTQR